MNDIAQIEVYTESIEHLLDKLPTTYRVANGHRGHYQDSQALIAQFSRSMGRLERELIDEIIIRTAMDE